jgi:hypothetical protein
MRETAPLQQRAAIHLGLRRRPPDVTSFLVVGAIVLSAAGFGLAVSKPALRAAYGEARTKWSLLWLNYRPDYDVRIPDPLP